MDKQLRDALRNAVIAHIKRIHLVQDQVPKSYSAFDVRQTINYMLEHSVVTTDELRQAIHERVMQLALSARQEIASGVRPGLITSPHALTYGLQQADGQQVFDVDDELRTWLINEYSQEKDLVAAVLQQLTK